MTTQVLRQPFVSQSALIAWIVVLCSPALAGELEIRIVQEDNGQIIPARIAIEDQRGRHPKPRGLPVWQQEFTSDGPFVLKLGRGSYRHRIERGPEYHGLFGTFVMESDATDNKVLKLRRHIEMKKHDWWSGDIWTFRRHRDAAILALGEDLHLLSTIQPDDTKEPGSVEIVQGDRAIDATVNVVTDELGSLLIRRTNDLHVNDKSLSSTCDRLKVLNKSTHFVITQPEAWGTPVWLATGRIDTMITHRPTFKREAEPPGRERNETLFPEPNGVGRYREHIYYQALEAGLRIAPAAGTGSGKSQQHPGQHRTYVWMPGPFDASEWWKRLENGQSVTTNGPLMIPKVNGEPPGHVFYIDEGDSIDLQTSLRLHTRTKIDYLEFIKNGETYQEIRLAEWAQSGQPLPKVTFRQSGWMVIRAVANNPSGYEYGSTAPYYVQAGDTPRISRSAVQFFAQWLRESAAKLQKIEPDRRQALLPYLRYARSFWEKQSKLANTE